MQKLQDSVFSLVKTNNLSPAVFDYLQPSEDSPDKTPLGGILGNTKHGWLALGPKFCVVDLRTGLKVASRTFGVSLSNFRTQVTCVVELPTPLTANSQQLVISLECEDIAGIICVFHINGSQILRCIQTDVVVTQLAVYDEAPDGPFTCFDGIVMAGTKSGEIFAFDLNRESLIQALNDIAQGFEHLVRKEENCASINFLPLNAVAQIEPQRELALENDDHIALLLNENSFIDNQYIFRNPDGTARMKAKRDHIRVTSIQYIPQLGSLAVGFNFGAFQIWNLLNLELEFTSQVNVECLPVTHFGFQEPCDDPRAFCYLWVVFSVLDRFDEEEFPLAVLYSLTYQGKRMLSDTKCLYQEFLTATVRFQVELSTTEEDSQLVGGKCISCHTYSVNSTLGSEGEDNMLNLCHLIWECWGENASAPTQHGMLLFDLDQWYKDQMPATYRLQSNAFMSATCCRELGQSCTTLDVRLSVPSVAVYLAPARLEEHFYPNSLYYECVCLNTSESCVLRTVGIQRQIIYSMDEVGPTALLNPTRLYNACVTTGLVPLYVDPSGTTDQEEQRRYLLSVALESWLSGLLKRCAHQWATGSHGGVNCTLPFLVDWSWKRAIELKENARELTAPLFTSSAQPDRNVVRCLEHCVQQLSQLTGLLDAVLTKCCNLVVPDALSEMEDKYKAIGTVSLYFQVVQWFLRCGLLPERSDASTALPYPGANLAHTYSKRRMKLQRLQEPDGSDSAAKPCPLLYIDQLIENEFGGERIHEMWIRGGSESHGLYPPPSLYALLRLYLLPDVAEEHKHSLLLYLLVDYSMVYDEVRYEPSIRRLMQFPTMFGLSNTAIKATQAFWHLDHRDFDFALDQLQCLTGNTLSEWQHSVVLSSLLAQKKTQAALQYLHVRKPAPIQSVGRDDLNHSRVNDHDKLEDWQSCCNLYLARGLVFQALDVIRACAQNEPTLEEKVAVLNFFFKGCRNTGQLSKLIQVNLLPFEEDVFIKYLESCNEPQTSDILVMYYIHQARYIEAEQYNKKLKHSKSRAKDVTGSIESLADIIDREGARNTLVEVVCSSLPTIANNVAHFALQKDIECHITAPKPMSVFVHAKSPKNKFTYKSSFIQDTIENASETWLNKPMMRRGMKRALNVQETPFICTPKLSRNRSILTFGSTDESTPSKRPKLDQSGTPKTPKAGAFRSEQISAQMSALLDMPEEPSPQARAYDRTGAETPHSILKTRMSESMYRGAPSPVDSRYLGYSDEELETASNHTHYSDSTNKHLRFTIPTASESGSTPSPPAQRPIYHGETETRLSASVQKEKDADKDSLSLDSYSTTESHVLNEFHPLESPPKKMATEAPVRSKKTFKDSVKARRSLSISANSSLSEDPNASIESIADIPVTLINPRYSGERQRYVSPEKDTSQTEKKDMETAEEGKSDDGKEKLLKLEVPKTPKGRKSIRGVSGQSTPLRSRSVTPERQDSPVILTPLRPLRITRSRSRTPEISPRSSPLEPIPEQPRQEVASEPHERALTLPAPIHLRSHSRTPERILKLVESPRLEAIHESPTKSESSTSSPTRRSLRSRSCTPEIEISKPKVEKDTSMRRRAKTPEKLMSPKKDVIKSAKKPLSRLVLEANAAKTIQKEKETEIDGEKPEIVECTPMKGLKQVPSFMDVTISPIASNSILQISNDSLLEAAKESPTADNSIVDLGMKSLPAFTMNETRFGKSVLQSYESSAGNTPTSETDVKVETKSESKVLKSVPAFSLIESYFEKSVLKSYESSVADASSESLDKEKHIVKEKIEIKESQTSTSLNITNIAKSVLGSYQSMDFEQDDTTHASTSRAMSSLMTSDSDIDISTRDTKEIDISTRDPKEVDISTRDTKDLDISTRDTKDIEISTRDPKKVDISTQDIKYVDISTRDTKDIDVSTRDTKNVDISTRDTKEERSNIVDAAAKIQKEKQLMRKINEMQQNINRMEEATSEDEDDEEDEEDEDQSDQGIDTESDDDGVEAEESSGDASGPEDEAIGSDADVISIADTDEDEKGSVDENSEAEQCGTENSDGENEADEDEVNENEADENEFKSSSSSSPKLRIYDDEDQEMQSENIHTERNTNIDLDIEVDLSKGNNEKDPLNQAHLSLLTDDSSIRDQSISIDFNEKQKATPAADNIQEAMDTDVKQTAAVEIRVEIEVTTDTTELEQEMEIDTAKITEEKLPQSLDVLDTSASFAETIGIPSKDDCKLSDKDTAGDEAKKLLPQKEDTPDIDVRRKSNEQEISGEKSQVEESFVETPAPRTRRRATSTSSNKSTKSTKESTTGKAKKSPSQKEDTEDIDAETKSIEQEISDSKSQVEETFVETPAPRIRRRAMSTSSNKSTKSAKESKLDQESKKKEENIAEISENIEPKTPRTRKRTKSNASNQSATESEQKTPEGDPRPITPSRRRAKTPTAEVRKIMTRRASKEIESTINESQVVEEVTPARRSTRSRSKNIDDNASIASGSSVGSMKSKASEAESKTARKGRKSTLSTKTDLSVIPELTIEESKIEDSSVQNKEDLIKEYSQGRRLTRHQKSLLESLLQPVATPSPRRASSRHSRHSRRSTDDDDDDDASISGFDAQSMDRMSLLNKGDFEGSPDPSEVQSTVSPESIASDASKQRRLRMARALSESKTTAPKAARITRRVSVDVAGSPGLPGSPAGLGSPARGRRASFTKACEALHTPKGRRTSTDLRKGEGEVAAESPVTEASTTPSRRARRTSSQYSSATSTSAKAQPGERSKRTPSLDESKDTKNK